MTLVAFWNFLMVKCYLQKLLKFEGIQEFLPTALEFIKNFLRFVIFHIYPAIGFLVVGGEIL